jgi:hypothetical protein
VNGNEQPTNHPVNGLTNNGFGVTDPAAPSGHGAGAGAGHSGGQGSSHIDGDIAAAVANEGIPQFSHVHFHHMWA